MYKPTLTLEDLTMNIKDKTQAEVVQFLQDWSEIALVYALPTESERLYIEAQLTGALDRAQFEEYVSKDEHPIAAVINIVQLKMDRSKPIKGLSDPFNDSSRAMGTDINGRPIGRYGESASKELLDKLK